MFADYKYCFLRNVLTDTMDNTKGFRFMLSDSRFNKFALYSTDVTGLINLNSVDSLIKDFSIENSILKCDDVERVQLIAADIASLNQIIPLENDNNSFSDFLEYGIANDYIIVDKNILEEDYYVGDAFVLFHNIEFAQSTMSVYAKMVSDGQMHNEMLVKMDGHQLLINNFHFACMQNVGLPEWFKGEYANFIKTMEINNITYDVYQFDNMPLYPNNILIGGAFINKAMAMRTKYKNLLGVLTELKNTLYDMEGASYTNSVEWVGGNKSYESPYGVYFKSSIENLTKNQKIQCISWFFELINKYQQESDIMAEIEERGGSALIKLAMKLIYNLMCSDSEVAGIIVNCTDAIYQYKKEQLNFDLYLYKIRLFSYLHCINIAPKRNPVLLGSDENAYTVVDSRLFYGMV